MEPALSPEIQGRLGQELQSLYGELVVEALPNRFADLIQQLERTLGSIVEPELRASILGALPSLRAFAISLTNNVDRADDLVQETVYKAWKNIHRFERGTNLNAWLFTILRNQFHTEFRKRVREVEDADGSYAERLRQVPEQPGKIAVRELQEALTKLPADQREALILVAAEGMSYDEVAQVCNVAVGTIKSRVNRARGRLAGLLAIDDVEDLGPDRMTRATFRGE